LRQSPTQKTGKPHFSQIAGKAGPVLAKCGIPGGELQFFGWLSSLAIKNSFDPGVKPDYIMQAVAL
jgi:hypothetical protein